ETRNPKPETRNPKPETRNLNSKPETQNPKPETRNPKPETRWRAPGKSRPSNSSGAFRCLSVHFDGIISGARAPHSGLRTFHQQSTFLKTINFEDFQCKFWGSTSGSP
ncbi:hypothetical protein T484DRAFT_1630500, partial [Baffinella frigidus]